MGVEVNEISAAANGGTELLIRGLSKLLPKELADQVQIIPSRVRELDPTKIRILWCHDLPTDPESDNALLNEGWRRFHKIVFVSNWQMQAYISHYKLPWDRCCVIRNAIVPFEPNTKDDEKIRIIYHSTPHRGLTLLAPVFKKLTETHKDIHLDVYSSFKLYGWEERDAPYKKLYEELQSMPQVTYHGTVSNEEIRNALLHTHIFAYPSIWLETSCLCLIEAMAAGVLCVHPNYGALFETAANWTMMYQWDSDQNAHANKLYGMLEHAIKNVRLKPTKNHLHNQAAYTNMFYNWDVRSLEWVGLITSLLNEPREIPRDPNDGLFIYRG